MHSCSKLQVWAPLGVYHSCWCDMFSYIITTCLTLLIIRNHFSAYWGPGYLADRQLFVLNAENIVQLMDLS